MALLLLKFTIESRSTKSDCSGLGQLIFDHVPVMTQDFKIEVLNSHGQSIVCLGGIFREGTREISVLQTTLVFLLSMKNVVVSLIVAL